MLEVGIMEDKLEYTTPLAQIVIFPQQDILTTSGDYGIRLPMDDWE